MVNAPNEIYVEIDGKIVIGGEITLPLGSNVLRNIVRVNFSRLYAYNKYAYVNNNNNKI